MLYSSFLIMMKWVEARTTWFYTTCRSGLCESSRLRRRDGARTFFVRMIMLFMVMLSNSFIM